MKSSHYDSISADGIEKAPERGKDSRKPVALGQRAVGLILGSEWDLIVGDRGRSSLRSLNRLRGTVDELAAGASLASACDSDHLPEHHGDDLIHRIVEARDVSSADCELRESSTRLAWHHLQVRKQPRDCLRWLNRRSQGSGCTPLARDGKGATMSGGTGCIEKLQAVIEECPPIGLGASGFDDRFQDGDAVDVSISFDHFSFHVSPVMPCSHAARDVCSGRRD